MATSWGRAPEQIILLPLAPEVLHERLLRLTRHPWDRAFHRQRHHATVTMAPAGAGYRLAITLFDSRRLNRYAGRLSVTDHPPGSQLRLQVWQPAMTCGEGALTALWLVGLVAACASLIAGRLPLLTILCGVSAVFIGSWWFGRNREPTAIAHALAASLRGYLTNPNGGYH